MLFNVMEEHAEAFFARLGEEGASLPAFVHAEFERYLCCGRLEEGFVRVVCTGCRHEHLVAFNGIPSALMKCSTRATWTWTRRRKRLWRLG